MTEHDAQAQDDELAQVVERGRQTRAKLFGEQHVYREGRGAADEIAPEVSRISDEVLWGRIWSDPTVDLRTRSMCTVTALLVLERYDYARAHIHGARNLGITREELTALVTQLVFYIGLPVAHIALAIIQSVYDSPPEAPMPSPAARYRG